MNVNANNFKKVKIYLIIPINMKKYNQNVFLFSQIITIFVI